MTRPVQFCCDHDHGYCECPEGRIALVKATEADAMQKFNRATTSFATALILVALIAAIFAVGLLNEENRLAQQAITNQENVSWK